MSKKDIRVYFDAEYCDYLKQVAEEQDVSVNHLIVSLVRKKYPMPRKQKQDFAPALDNSTREELQQRLDDITKLIDNAMANPSAKIQPKSAYGFLMEEQKRLKKLLDD